MSFLTGNGVNRRAVYKFDCEGGCGKYKSTFVYERAKKKICLSCERNQPDPNQASLFEEPIISGEVARVVHESRMKALNPLIQSDSHKRDVKYLAVVAES